MTHAVLLVDDDADVLHCLARMLRRQPYQLYTARSGEEAVHMLKARRVDVIVADERMPGMSGTALLAWVADNYPDVVRILLTGNATAEMVIQAVNEGGIYHVFTKPCNEARLAITIGKALEQKELLNKRAQLLEINQRQARDRERFAHDLEALNRLIVRDLRKPLHSVTQSCRSLLEQHRDLFDPKAESLIEETLESVSDMESLVEDLLARIRVWQSTGVYGHGRAEPQEAVAAGTCG